MFLVVILVHVSVPCSRPFDMSQASHEIVLLREAVLCVCCPSHCPTAPSDPSSKMYSPGLTIRSGSDSLGSSLPRILRLLLVQHMRGSLHLVHILHSKAPTLHWYTQCSRITVRYNNGSALDKTTNINTALLCICWRSADQLNDNKETVCMISVSINKVSIVL